MFKCSSSIPLQSKKKKKSSLIFNLRAHHPAGGFGVGFKKLVIRILNVDHFFQ